MSLQENMEFLSATLEKADAQVKTGHATIRTAHDGLTETRKQFQVQATAVVPASAAVTTRLQQGEVLADQSMKSLQSELQTMESGIVQRIEASRRKVEEMGQMVGALTSLLVKVEDALRQQQKTTEEALQQAGRQSQQAFLQSRTALNSLDEFVANSLLPKLRSYQQSNQTAVADLGQRVRDSFLPALDARINTVRSSLHQAVERLKQETELAASQMVEGQTEALATTTQQCADKVARLNSATRDSAKILAGVVAQVEDQLKVEAESNRSILETYNQRVQQDAKDQITIPVNLKLVLDRANIR